MAILKDKAYESAYSGTIDELVNKAVNREAFSYDPATDQAYQAYAKEYGRLGKQAREDTLGDVANNTGGLVSSYATTAAAQAQNQYNQALTDKIPELMQAAYSRYNDEFNNNLNMIGTLQGLDNDAYSRFSDQRTFDRGVFESDRDYNYQMGRDAVSDYQWQSEFDWNKETDQRDYDRNVYESDRDYDRNVYESDRDYNRDVFESDRTYDYQVERDKVADQQWQAEYDLDVRAQEYYEKVTDDQNEYERMLNTWTTLGYATKEVADYFGVAEGTQTSDYKFSAAQLVLDQAAQSLNEREFAYEQQKDADEKWEREHPYVYETSGGKEVRLNEEENNARAQAQMRLDQDSLGLGYGIIAGKNAAATYIDSLKLTDDQKDRIYNSLNFDAKTKYTK